MSKGQKTLKTFSIVSLIFGLIALVLGALMLLGSGAALGNVDSIVSEAGVTTEEVAEFSGVFIVTGIATILRGIANVVDWAFLKRVAKDATKYKPAWIVSLITTVMSVLSLFTQFSNGEAKDIAVSVLTLALNGYIFYLVNKVKQSVTA